MNEPMITDIRQFVSDAALEQAANSVGNDLGEGGNGRWKRAMAALGGSKIAAALNEKLQQLDLMACFVKGWAESNDLLKLSEGANSSPANPKHVRLGKFEQNLDLYPILTFSAMGISSDPIKLTLAFQAEFEAVEVGLTKGFIIEVGGGFCKLSALLKYGQFSFPAGVPPVEYQLKNTRRFADPGIKITGKQSVG